nr:vegetative cell wall protein gp1-like [Aegilops tauschii subsp. strangulata]
MLDGQWSDNGYSLLRCKSDHGCTRTPARLPSSPSARAPLHQRRRPASPPPPTAASDEPASLSTSSPAAPPAPPVVASRVPLGRTPSPAPVASTGAASSPAPPPRSVHPSPKLGLPSSVPLGPASGLSAPAPPRRVLRVGSSLPAPASRNTDSSVRVALGRLPRRAWPLRLLRPPARARVAPRRLAPSPPPPLRLAWRCPAPTAALLPRAAPAWLQARVPAPVAVSRLRHDGSPVRSPPPTATCRPIQLDLHAGCPRQKEQKRETAPHPVQKKSQGPAEEKREKERKCLRYAKPDGFHMFIVFLKAFGSMSEVEK